RCRVRVAEQIHRIAGGVEHGGDALLSRWVIGGVRQKVHGWVGSRKPVPPADLDAVARAVEPALVAHDQRAGVDAVAGFGGLPDNDERLALNALRVGVAGWERQTPEGNESQSRQPKA